MYSQCMFKSTTPLFACYNCKLFLETCTFIVSNEGFALGAECGDFYLCLFCQSDCIFKSYVNL